MYLPTVSSVLCITWSPADLARNSPFKAGDLTSQKDFHR
jgi:hypothetical protein